MRDVVGLPPASAARVLGAVPRVVRALAASAARPSDTPDERLRHVLLVALALLMSGGGLLWGVLCLAIGALWQSSIPFGYVAFTAVNLGVIRVHRNFQVTRALQLGCSLLLPFALQWGLGGFMASGAMMMWGLLALVGALTVQSARTTLLWLVVYIGLAALSVAIDPRVLPYTVIEGHRLQVLALALNICVITPIVFGLMLYFVRSAEQLNEALARSSLENERLVHRMLPVPVADRLRAGASTIADELDNTTVVFCDIVGFTSWSRTATAVAVVDTLRELFGRFDEATRRHGLEKIKTIGDAYMAAAGVPVPQDDHLERAVALAFELIDAAHGLRTPQGAPLAVRVGLESGPAVAGIIGQDKVLYDIWGPTVNLASRLESTGEAGQVHVSAQTRERLRGRVEATARAPIVIKGVGEVQTYFLHRPGAPPPHDATHRADQVG